MLGRGQRRRAISVDTGLDLMQQAITRINTIQTLQDFNIAYFEIPPDLAKAMLADCLPFAIRFRSGVEYALTRMSMDAFRFPIPWPDIVDRQGFLFGCKRLALLHAANTGYASLISETVLSETQVDLVVGVNLHLKAAIERLQQSLEHLYPILFKQPEHQALLANWIGVSQLESSHATDAFMAFTKAQARACSEEPKRQDLGISSIVHILLLAVVRFPEATLRAVSSCLDLPATFDLRVDLLRLLALPEALQRIVDTAANGRWHLACDELRSCVATARAGHFEALAADPALGPQLTRILDAMEAGLAPLGADTINDVIRLRALTETLTADSINLVYNPTKIPSTINFIG